MLGCLTWWHIAITAIMSAVWKMVQPHTWQPTMVKNIITPALIQTIYKKVVLVLIKTHDSTYVCIYINCHFNFIFEQIAIFSSLLLYIWKKLSVTVPHLLQAPTGVIIFSGHGNLSCVWLDHLSYCRHNSCDSNMSSCEAG